MGEETVGRRLGNAMATPESWRRGVWRAWLFVCVRCVWWTNEFKLL